MKPRLSEFFYSFPHLFRHTTTSYPADYLLVKLSSLPFHIACCSLNLEDHLSEDLSILTSNMMYSSSLTKGAYLALAVVSMFQASRANIMGCDAVDCPRDKYNETQCVIGNTTARAIGISSFTSELLSAQPLNWTVAVRPINNQQIVFERDFFLGKAVSTNTEVSFHCTAKQSSSMACIFRRIHH